MKILASTQSSYFKSDSDVVHFPNFGFSYKLEEVQNNRWGHVYDIIPCDSDFDEIEIVTDENRKGWTFVAYDCEYFEAQNEYLFGKIDKNIYSDDDEFLTAATNQARDFARDAKKWFDKCENFEIQCSKLNEAIGRVTSGWIEKSKYPVRGQLDVNAKIKVVIPDGSSEISFLYNLKLKKPETVNQMTRNVKKYLHIL